ncbi:hypothetical protein, partial [Aquirufa ecclesiirivi]|uniref:hypothetical protein n=1 Tax=Aquirufa ecclesiirivi TaxID=2715124 RepID=UPI0023D8165B
PLFHLLSNIFMPEGNRYLFLLLLFTLFSQYVKEPCVKSLNKSRSSTSFPLFSTSVEVGGRVINWWRITDSNR